MANLRDLKKHVRIVCGDLAGDALLAAAIFPEKVDSERINSIINEIAALQEDTIALMSINFDRGRRDFVSPKEYRKERRKYFEVAFKKLEKDFLDRAIEIVNQLNDSVPADARKSVSEL